MKGKHDSSCVATANGSCHMSRDIVLVVGQYPLGPRDEFLELLDAWGQNVVLLIDELSKLNDAQPYIRDEFMRSAASLLQVFLTSRT